MDSLAKGDQGRSVGAVDVEAFRVARVLLVPTIEGDGKTEKRIRGNDDVTVFNINIR